MQLRAEAGVRMELTQVCPLLFIQWNYRTHPRLGLTQNSQLTTCIQELITGVAKKKGYFEGNILT